MANYPANEVFTRLAKPTTLSGIIKQVFARIFVTTIAPQAQVNMCAAASLVEERLGGKRSECVKSSCHTPRCLAYETDVIGSFQHISMMYREFLLRGAKLRVE